MMTFRLQKLGRKNILHPQGQFLQTWNKMFLLCCAIALAVDPLFFYIPVVDGDRKCLDLDVKLEIVACVLRTFIDAFYVLHMIFQFRTAFLAPSSRLFGRGELIEDPRLIAKRYLVRFFFIDILSVLPLPQVVILIMHVQYLNGHIPLVTKESLKYVIICQYAPRIARIFPFSREITRIYGIFIEIARAAAALNLYLYMVASHAAGALWYLFSIERQYECWRNAYHGKESALYCGSNETDDTLVNLLNTSCPLNNSSIFNFGIFIDALELRVVETKHFRKKIFYCFWWGLRNLSSLGQDLKTSTYDWEILFAIGIGTGGLVLFSFLIGNMQKCLQLTGDRVAEMRAKRQDAEQWMSNRMLPKNLKDRVRQYLQYIWRENRGVEEEMLLSILPRDLSRDIKRHLCLDLLKRVPMFEKMNEQLLDAMCDRLKPALYTDKSYLVREGDTLEEMLFITRGNLISTTTNGGRPGFFNAVLLKAGDFCGDGLLTWALDPHSSSNLPISTTTVQALTEVEIYAIMADDLKFLASQFRRFHSKQVVHTFRYYSLQWRTWAACFIQVAWRRYCKRKLIKSLREAQNRLQDALVKRSGNSPTLGATLYASKFAANALRNLRNNGSQSPRLPQRLLPLLPQKRAEPDFTGRNGSPKEKST